MFRRLRIGPARWAAVAAAAVALAGTGLAVVANPAYAERFPITDDFEGTPENRWVIDQYPNQSSVRFGTHPNAAGHGKVATLDAGTSFPIATSARIHRTVTPDAGSSGNRCTLTLSVKEVDSVASTPTLYVKIRSGGPNGTVLSATAKTVTTSWASLNVGSIPYPSGAFAIDVLVHFGAVFVDDVRFAC